MIEFRLSVDALSNTRFGYSPLAEVQSSLRQLGAPVSSFLMRRWLEDVTDQVEDVDLELLGAVAPPGKWTAYLLTAWSPDPKVTLERQLEEYAGLPADDIRADLEQVWRDRPMPDRLRRTLAGPKPGIQIATAIQEYWQIAIAPYWSRIRAVLDDDVAYRAGRAVSQGITAVFDDLHPEVSVGDRVILVDKPHHADLSYRGTRITLIPSVFVWPALIIGHEQEDAFSLAYGARGVARVWEGLPPAEMAESDLGTLLGRNRAAILQRLGVPMTTTQLARELGQSPGTVNQHLKVLQRNGLLDSWRSGRSVLYRRTDLAGSIIAASEYRGAVTRLRPGTDAS